MMRKNDESLGTWGDSATDGAADGAADGTADGHGVEDHSDTGDSADNEGCKGEEEWSCALEG